MSDISNETSMEDILSSIKRIIAEEAEPVSALTRARRPSRPLVDQTQDEDRADLSGDDVLDLDAFATSPGRRDPLDDPRPEPVASPAPAAMERPPVQPQPAAAEPILSATAAHATTRSLETLSRMIVRPDVQGSDTLEGLVKEMLRPMLRDWLDAHLPEMVETLVAREIARITGRQG